MIYEEIDPFNQAGRYDVLMNEEDARKLGITDGETVVLYNRHGRFQGKARFVNIRSGNLEVHWPEGNCLIPKGVYEQHAGIPEYNTVVIMEKAETFHAQKDTHYVEKRVDELEMEIG